LMQMRSYPDEADQGLNLRFTQKVFQNNSNAFLAVLGKNHTPYESDTLQAVDNIERHTSRQISY